MQFALIRAKSPAPVPIPRPKDRKAPHQGEGQTFLELRAHTNMPPVAGPGPRP